MWTTLTREREQERGAESVGTVEGKFAEAYPTNPEDALSTVVGLSAADALARALAGVVNRWDGLRLVGCSLRAG